MVVLIFWKKTIWPDAKNNHPLPLLERKEGSWTVLALMVLPVKWLCSCYSPPNLGGVGVVIVKRYTTISCGKTSMIA